MSTRDYSNQALCLLASQKDDLAFTSYVKKIIKDRYVEENLSLLQLSKKICIVRRLEREVVAELIIEKSIIEDSIYLKNGIDIAIKNIDIESLWIGTRDSKNEYIRELCKEKLWNTIETIEVESNLEREKQLKLGRKQNDKY